MRKRKMTFETCGRALGYPECCIKAFCAFEHFKDLKEGVISYNGYVPCSSCREKTREELEVIVGRKFNDGSDIDIFRKLGYNY